MTIPSQQKTPNVTPHTSKITLHPFLFRGLRAKVRFCFFSRVLTHRMWFPFFFSLISSMPARIFIHFHHLTIFRLFTFYGSSHGGNLVYNQSLNTFLMHARDVSSASELKTPHAHRLKRETYGHPRGALDRTLMEIIHGTERTTDLYATRTAGIFSCHLNKHLTLRKTKPVVSSIRTRPVDAECRIARRNFLAELRPRCSASLRSNIPKRSWKTG